MKHSARANRPPRVEVRSAELAITLDADDRGTAPNPGAGQRLSSDWESSPLNDAEEAESPTVLIVPWTKPAPKRRREIIAPDQGRGETSRPIRAESRARLVLAIARGRLWLSQIESGAVGGVTEIALREDCSPRHVNMTMSLAFLAPSLVKAAVDGRLPHGIGLARLIDAPAEWGRQYRMLGLTP